jgi:hypothetical protein
MVVTLCLAGPYGITSMEELWQLVLSFQIEHKMRLGGRASGKLHVIVANYIQVSQFYGGRGSTVVKVLRYISEGRWFDPRWCHCNFSLT